MRKKELVEQCNVRVQELEQQAEACRHSCDDLVRRVEALEAVLTPLTKWDFHALQFIAGLQHDGHDLRAIHVEDAAAINEQMQRAKTVLYGLPFMERWSTDFEPFPTPALEAEEHGLGRRREVSTDDLPGAPLPPGAPYLHEDGTFHDDRPSDEADVPAPPPHMGEEGTGVSTPVDSEAQRRIRHLEQRIASQRAQLDHLISERKLKKGAVESWHRGRESLLRQQLREAQAQWTQERDRRVAVEAQLKANAGGTDG